MSPFEASVFPPADPLEGLGKRRDPWWSPEAAWVSNGTEALYWAFVRLARAGARPFVWIPSYHCGLEVQAALDAGWEVGFVPVAHDLCVSAEAVRRVVSKGRATVLLIHYYGFVQPEIDRLRDVLDQAGMLLLEDCTHALGSRVGVPAGADVGVYSLPKSLPVVDGGLLEISPQRILEKLGRAPGSPGPLRSSSDARLGWIKATVKSILGPGLLRRLRGPAMHAEVPQWSNDDPGTYGFRTSGWTRRVAGRTALADLVERRRENYRLLVDLLEDVRPAMMFPELGEGDCPLGLPLRVSDRRRLVRSLRSEGIEPYIFGEFAHPALPSDAFPVAGELRDQILALPTHHRLTPRAIREIGTRALGLLIDHHVTLD